ncbi:MAG: hypothetical protein ACTTI3_08545 [Treponema sp.]
MKILLSKILRFFMVVCTPVLFFTYCTASPQTQEDSSQEVKEQHEAAPAPSEKKEEPTAQSSSTAAPEPKKVASAALPKEQAQPLPKQEPTEPVQKEKIAVSEKTENKPQQAVKQEEPQQEPPKVETPQLEEPKKEEKKEKSGIVAEFEGVKITKETYVQTKSEIELVVDELNHITAQKDYNRWVSFLAPSYKEMYADQTILKAASEALPIKGIQLKTLRDYFLYVFVPSRQNIKVDDIQFLSPTQVNVLMLHGKDLLLVYRIEHMENGWKLIPSRFFKKK